MPGPHAQGREAADGLRRSVGELLAGREISEDEDEDEAAAVQVQALLAALGR